MNSQKTEAATRLVYELRGLVPEQTPDPAVGSVQEAEAEAEAPVPRAKLSKAERKERAIARRNEAESTADSGKPEKAAKKFKSFLRCTTFKVTRPSDFLVSGRYPPKDYIEVTSWRMAADHVYYKEPYEYPTRARGLFTVKVDGYTDGTQEVPELHKVLIRGYDKFFNVNEVSSTEVSRQGGCPPCSGYPERSEGGEMILQKKQEAWREEREERHHIQPSALSANTAPPYELTVKSNGCIIFIAALSPSTLIVTSKHSLGARPQGEDDVTSPGSYAKKTVFDMSHSERGEYWLVRQLETVGMSCQDLARTLYEHDWTAVAELCDDAFEEHVLPYVSSQTGLHLHGINLNLAGTLVTLPAEDVAEYAQRWGLIPTSFSTFPSIIALNTYCDEVSRMGGIVDEANPGRIIPIEGFVVRAKLRKRSSIVAQDPNASVFFWKIKYDEPYLMYREWREVTKRLLGNFVRKEVTGGDTAAPHAAPEAPLNPASLASLNLLDTLIRKAKRPESKAYLSWVAAQIEADIMQFESWKYNRGIIQTRERFIAYCATPAGEQLLKSFSSVASNLLANQRAARRDSTRPDRLLIVPIAGPAAGKTALGVALCDLFSNWVHVQSDNFSMRKSAPHFINAIRGALANPKTAAVYADKLNHMVKLRRDLIAVARALESDEDAEISFIRVVAVVWDLNKKEDGDPLPRDSLHKLLASRIVARGQNHQSLKPDTAGSHLNVLRLVLSQYAPLDEDDSDDGLLFDDVIHLNLFWDQEKCLTEVVRVLTGFMGELSSYPVERENKDGDSVGDTAGEAVTPAIDALSISTDGTLPQPGLLGVYSPSPAQIQAALAASSSYVAKTNPPASDSSATPKKKKVRPAGFRYYGLHVEVFLQDQVRKYVQTDPAALRMFDSFEKDSRIQPYPHITLVHTAEVNGEEGPAREHAARQWAACEQLVPASGSRPTEDESKERRADVILGPLIVYDSRVMVLGVSSISVPENSKVSPLMLERFEQNSEAVRHITIATLRDDIRPVEGKYLLETYLAGLKRGEHAVSSELGGTIHVIDMSETISVPAHLKGFNI